MTENPETSYSSLPAPGQRIAVVGVTGCGKTTFAGALALRLGYPHIELDALHWLPGWQEPPLDVFRASVLAALSGPCWISDGNYRKIRVEIWQRADTLIWLDYSLPVILWRLVKRTWQRVVLRQELWNGNRESWRGAFFSRDSLFLWALQTHPLFRKTYPQFLAQPENAHLRVVRLKTPAQAARWLASLIPPAGQSRL